MSIIDNFKLNTLDPLQFMIEDVIDDNACFYRVLANGLFYNSAYDTAEEIVTYLGEWDLSKEDIKDSHEWGYFGDEQEILSKYIQQEIVSFIQENRDTPLDEFSKKFSPYNMTFSELILMTHDMDIDEYCHRYSFFAGDIVHLTTEDGDIEIMDGRWGGLVEQIAFSYSFKVPLKIYVSQKYSQRYKKIISGRVRNNKAEKGVRFLFSQSIGEEFLETSPPILMLWKKMEKGDHYMALYKKKC